MTPIFNSFFPRAANNSLMLTRLAAGNAVNLRLASCPRMKERSLSRRAA